MEQFKDYGMREYKMPLKQRISTFIALHPFVVTLILVLIISILFGGCQKAYAEEIQLSTSLPEYYWHELNLDNSQYADNMDDFFQPYYDGIMPYSFMLKDNSGNVCVVLCRYEDPVLKGQTQANAITSGFYLYTRGGNNDDSFMGYKTWHQGMGEANEMFRVASYRVGGYGWAFSKFNMSAWNYNYYSSERWVGCFTSMQSIPNLPFFSNTYQWLPELNTSGRVSQIYIPEDSTYYAVDYGTYAGFGNYETYSINTSMNNVNILVERQPSNTEGFEVYKTTKSGIDYLVFDMLNAVPANLRNDNWYLTDLTSSLGFDVITETGTYNFQYSFDIDDSSDDFPYNGQYFKWQDDWGNLKLQWWIPIDELELPDDAYGYTSNVVATVSESLTIPYLGLFSYVTPVYLYGTQADSGLIDPDDVIPITPESNPVSQETKDKNSLVLEFGTLQSVQLYQFKAFMNNTPIGTTYYTVYYEQRSWNWSDFLSNFINVNDIPNALQYWYEYYSGVQDIDDAISRMRDFIYDNAVACEADYIVFVYDGSDADYVSGNYWVYETHKGRLSAISWLLDTSNTYFDKQFDIVSDLAAFTKTKIDTIDKNIYNMSTNQFSQNNSIIANLVSILNKVNGLDDTLRDLFNRLFSALSNLHLSQLDAIDTDLDTIITKLNTIASHDPNEYDTVEEAIAYYKANNDDGLPDSNVFTENRFSLWFSGKVHDWWSSVNHNGGDAQHPTASLLGATFDALKNTYESMTSETKILDNIIYIKIVLKQTRHICCINIIRIII